MANNLNTEAWDILNRDEKMSISLSLGHNKSSWEAGEIVGKSHYKYLEINARAERFLKMFTEFFEKYGDLIPIPNNMESDFKEYIVMLIKERRAMKDTLSRIENRDYQFTGSREVALENAMNNLRHSSLESEVELFDLLLEFDRWNNFRILPRRLQQPSAFKRRNKSRELKHLKSISDLPKYSVNKIRDKFGYTGYKRLFFTLVSRELKQGFIVIAMENTKKNISQVSQLGLFIFKDNLEAVKLGEMINQYLYPLRVTGFSPVVKGLTFWGPYRELISKSINYDKVYNLVPNRKYVEDALIEQQLKKKKVKRG